MELTLDGLIRSLRLAAHGLAEDAEAGYGPDERLTGRLAPSSFDRLRMRATDAVGRKPAVSNEGFEE